MSVWVIVTVILMLGFALTAISTCVLASRRDQSSEEAYPRGLAGETMSYSESPFHELTGTKGGMQSLAPISNRAAPNRA